jgi:phosphoglycolate phosphatase
VTAEGHPRADEPALPAPSVLLFDWDNTLIDSWPCIHRVVNVLMTRMGRPTWTMEETRKRIGRSMRDTFPDMFGDRWREAGEMFLDEFRAVHLDMLTVLDGMAPMLSALQARGVPMGLVSNKTGALLRREIEALGWQDLFFSVVGAGDAARDKPAPDSVALAMRDAPGAACGQLDASVWFIGDSATDMTCAHTCGLSPVLLRAWPPEDQEFGDHPPLVHLPSGDHLVRAVDDARAADARTP